MTAPIIFQLWDLESANLIADYDTEGAALAYVREVVRCDGQAYVESWELARTPSGKDAQTIATGAELARVISGLGRA